MAIDRAKSHKRARELVADPFFWDCADELAPFGSDEGDTALAEFRAWRKKHRRSPVVDCIRWTIESVGEMDAAEYTDDIVKSDTVRKQLRDPDFNDQQYIYTLDVSVIATGFAQLVDEGTIDPAAKPYILRALRRQVTWAKLQATWKHGPTYVRNLQRLEEILSEA